MVARLKGDSASRIRSRYRWVRTYWEHRFEQYAPRLLRTNRLPQLGLAHRAILAPSEETSAAANCGNSYQETPVRGYAAAFLISTS